MPQFKGIFPALITPFTKDNRINEGALRKIIQLNLAKGVDGFYVGGSTGEAFLLSMEERKQILAVAAEETKGKCTLIYHIGCIGTDQAIELGQYAEKMGVDAISSVSPFYYKFSFEEIKRFYINIVDEVNLPMIIYNFPALSGVTLTSENIKEFSSDKRFIGIKHTSMDLYQLERMKKTDERLLVFNGHDEVFLGGLVMGADGAIGSTYNFMAEYFLNIRRLFHDKKIEQAQQMQGDANEIIEILIKTGVFQGIKYILGKMGIECGSCRSPFKPIDQEGMEMLDKVLKNNMYL